MNEFQGKFVETSTEDGIRLQGLLAEAEKTDTAVIHFHGMSGNFYANSFIKPMLSRYPSENISFLTVEQRGSETIRLFETTEENIVTIGNAYEKFEDSKYDIDAWIDFLEKELGEKPGFTPKLEA
ncbi:MAG: hypothetical protein ABEJ72_08295, partial [Candidatus Aenigmatarchaeota archaeon]